MEEELETRLRARVPLIWLHSQEEDRSLTRVVAVARKLDMAVFDWRAGGAGYAQVSPGKLRPPGDGQCTNIDRALRATAEYKQQATLFAFRDFDSLFSRMHQSPDCVTLIRILKDLRREFKRNSNAIVFLTSTPVIPRELTECVSLVEAAMPGQGERVGIIRAWLQTNVRDAVVDDEFLFRSANAAAGMSSNEIQTALALSVIKRKGISPELVEDLVERKVEVVRSTEVLEYVQVNETLDNVGGLAGIKKYLLRRTDAYGRAAEAYGLTPPKGILLIGPPGTGKSLLAKAAASILRFALIRFDVGRIHGSLVGQSEERLRQALALADVQAPCVLWIDELEKAFAGVGGASRDGGVSQRVFGGFLTWMQERTSRVFVFATANNISQLPPEFLRKGRFDEIFAVDLPTADERREILNVLLRRRGRESKKLITSKLIEQLDRFSGAEMEAVVDEALYEAFFDNQRALKKGDLEAAAAAAVPVADQMRDQIEQLRQWGRANARPAS